MTEAATQGGQNQVDRFNVLFRLRLNRTVYHYLLSLVFDPEDLRTFSQTMSNLYSNTDFLPNIA